MKLKLQYVKDLFVSLILISAGTVIRIAKATETTAEKIENKVDEAKKNTKKSARNLKRKARNRAGEGSALKDLKDKSKDARDELSYRAKKAKRKAD